MKHGKPVIGVAGGIGSGKSFVADLFGELGCLVIKSDDQIRRAYDDDEIVRQLRQWWGDAVFGPDGRVNRRAIAERVFLDPAERRRLERLLHPFVARQREQLMLTAADDPTVVAYVWDTPLLFETGLDQQCDAVVFVDTPFDLRLKRVSESRGWDAGELIRRENLQRPLDRKRQISDHVVTNTADAGFARTQVREVISRIFSERSDGKAAGEGVT